jgi:hypothetical protein
MKKITLLFILMIAFNWQSNAQLTEGFEGGVVPPAGWTSFENGFGAAQVWQVSATANTGTNAAYIRFDTTDPGNSKEDWLVTSAVDLTGVTDSQLRFAARQQFEIVYNSQYEIRVSTNSQTTPGDFTSVQTWDETTLNSTYNVYEEKVVDLSAYDGMTIYIAFVHTNDDGDSWYVDDVSVAAAPSCERPLTTSVTNASVTADLSWSASGTETGGYEWVIMSDGDDPDVDTPVTSGSTGTGVTSDTASGLTTSLDYDFYVRTICSGPTTSSWSNVFNFFTIPVNDNACDAIDLTSSINSATSGGTYSNVYSSAETAEPIGSCWFSQSVDNSIWFKFTAPASGEVRITTNINDVPFSTNNDLVLTLYTTTDCSDLSQFAEVGCADDVSGSNFRAELDITGLSGEYYVQIDGGGTDVGNFDVGFYDLTTLSNDTVEQAPATLSYFPNPVKDKLTLKAQQNIQNVSVFNMLGQEVMRTEMNVQRGDLDMSSLQAGPYFVKVNINGNVETLRIIKK